MKMIKLGLLVGLLSFLNGFAHADEMLIIRSSQQFEEAMSTLQAAIKHHGYTLAKVQRVDVGLTAKGYKTDRYRVVFFGKGEEVDRLSTKYPQLIPFMPLNIAIFAEDGETILTTNRPAVLKSLFPDPKLAKVFDQWDKDMIGIMDEVRETE